MNVLIRKVRSGYIRAKRLIRSQRFGFDPAEIYSESFFEDGGFHKTEHSARVIAAWVAHHLDATSMLDLGAGAGYYLKAFAHVGVEVLGLEASPIGVRASGPDVLAVAFDLKRPVHLSRKFELVMCVEVAEHIPKGCSDTLVESICSNCAKYVLFTAAPPGTPGNDHINCQPAEFWHSLFARHGFSVRADLTESLRATARNEDTADWWKSWAWCLQRSA